MAIIKCRECGADISSEAKACPHCGCPSKEKKPFPQLSQLPMLSKLSELTKLSKKMIAIISAGIAIVFILVVVLSSTAWTRKFDITYEGSWSNYDGLYDGEIYTITNKSHTAAKIVSVIIKVESEFGKKYRIKDDFDTWIGPGESITYAFGQEDFSDALGESNIYYENVEIVRIKWK